MSRYTYILAPLLCVLLLAACAPSFDMTPDANRATARDAGLPDDALTLLNDLLGMMQREDYTLVSAEAASDFAPFIAAYEQAAAADAVWCVLLQVDVSTETEAGGTPIAGTTQSVWRWMLWREDADWVDAMWILDDERDIWEGAGCSDW